MPTTHMMTQQTKALIMVFGDGVLLSVSLLLVLIGRYFPFPSDAILAAHLEAFSVLIGIWLVVFFIAGLYERKVLFSRRQIVGMLTKVQAVNTGIAVAFFYLIPFFSITPKTNLFLYLVISFGLIVWWRFLAISLFDSAQPQHAILITTGEEKEKLVDAASTNPRYGISFVRVYDSTTLTESTARDITKTMERYDITLVVADTHAKALEPVLSALYGPFVRGIRVIDSHDLYEDIFAAVPLAVLNHRWFFRNISTETHALYGVLKRVMDISIATVLGIVSLPLYVVVYLAMRFTDNGPLFFTQERVGRGGRIMTIMKFRSMKTDYGGEASVTRLGKVLRATRIDELPQLWNVIRGDLSLIGPRPEIPSLVKEYKEQIPYYGVRHIITPGLSGWAQLYHENHPHHGSDVRETKVKLAHDLYYIKNRSFLLDLIIALKTVRTFVMWAGR